MSIWNFEDETWLDPLTNSSAKNVTDAQTASNPMLDDYALGFFRSDSLESWSTQSSGSTQLSTVSSASLQLSSFSGDALDILNSDSLGSWSTINSASPQLSVVSSASPQLSSFSGDASEILNSEFLGSRSTISSASSQLSVVSSASPQLSSFSGDASEILNSDSLSSCFTTSSASSQLSVVSSANPQLSRFPEDVLEFLKFDPVDSCSMVNSATSQRSSFSDNLYQQNCTEEAYQQKPPLTSTSLLDFKNSNNARDQKQSTMCSEDHTVQIIEEYGIKECLDVQIDESKQEAAVVAKTERPVRRRRQIEKDDTKVFKCTVCNQECASNVTLKRHAKRHTDTTSYPCSECKKVFSEKFNLVRHMRTHTGIKPFSCEYCDKRFTQRAQMETHLKVHGVKLNYKQKQRRDKLYICENCGYTSYEADEYYLHLEDNHPDSPLLQKVHDRRYFKFSGKTELSRKMMLLQKTKR